MCLHAIFLSFHQHQDLGRWLLCRAELTTKAHLIRVKFDKKSGLSLHLGDAGFKPGCFCALLSHNSHSEHVTDAESVPW